VVRTAGSSGEDDRMTLLPAWNKDLETDNIPDEVDAFKAEIEWLHNDRRSLLKVLKRAEYFLLDIKDRKNGPLYADTLRDVQSAVRMTS
jgi:hypothetical protein